MAKYEMEIVTRKGNKFRDGGKTLIETRKKACRIAKKEDAIVYIRKWDNYWHVIEHIFYDDMKTPYSPYSNLRPGFYLQKTSGKKHTRHRVSPKTGNLLDVSKEWKSI